MSLKRTSKGFTLIELMIVVAIIGILAAVAVPKFADLVTKSKEASVKGSLGSVRSALSIYYGDTEGIFPVNLHAGLCTANKYLPSVGNVSSLGRFEIPSHSAGTTNPGHTAGFFRNASGGGAVLNDNTGTVDPVEGAQSLVYGILGSSGVGEVFINCQHVDTKSQAWSGY